MRLRTWNGADFSGTNSSELTRSSWKEDQIARAEGAIENADNKL
jgi:hypothetical protein